MFYMFGACFWKFVLLGFLIDNIDNINAEKFNPNWFIHVGLKGSKKNMAMVKSNNKGINYGNGSYMFRNLMESEGTTSEISKKKSHNLYIQLSLRKSDRGHCGKPNTWPKSAFNLVQIGCNSYYFGTYFQANYFKAMEFCRDHGMDLLVIENNVEYQLLRDYLKANSNSIYHYWMMSLEWGRKFVLGSTGQPFTMNISNEECMEIVFLKYHPNKRYWIKKCSEASHFICKVPECNESCSPQKSRSSKKPPKLPLVELNGTSYYFDREKKYNFYEAMNFCENHGMRLLSIETMDEQSNIGAWSSIWNKYSIWTSGTDLGEEGKFAWLATGKPFDYTASVSSVTKKGQSCMLFHKIKAGEYVREDTSCKLPNRFICEVPKCNELCTNKMN